MSLESDEADRNHPLFPVSGVLLSPREALRQTLSTMTLLGDHYAAFVFYVDPSCSKKAVFFKYHLNEVGNEAILKES